MARDLIMTGHTNAHIARKLGFRPLVIQRIRSDENYVTVRYRRTEFLPDNVAVNKEDWPWLKRLPFKLEKKQ